MTSHFHDRLYDANTEHKTCSIYTTTVDGKVKAVWSSYFYPSDPFISVQRCIILRKNRNVGPGWISYFGTSAFYTFFIMTASEFLFSCNRQPDSVNVRFLGNTGGHSSQNPRWTQKPCTPPWLHTWILLCSPSAVGLIIDGMWKRKAKAGVSGICCRVGAYRVFRQNVQRIWK